MVCSADNGTTFSAGCIATTMRAVTAAPGRHRPSSLRTVARATVLWLAVAVPGNTRSSVVPWLTPSVMRVTVTGTPAVMCCVSAPKMCRSTHNSDRSPISNSGVPSPATAPTCACRASTTPLIGALML
ncbi:hypothetical protein D3C71_1448340 [compost metagenome]